MRLFAFAILLLLAMPAAVMAACHSTPSKADNAACHQQGDSGPHQPSAPASAIVSPDCIGCAIPQDSARPMAALTPSEPTPYRTMLAAFRQQHESGLDPPPPRSFG